MATDNHPWSDDFKNFIRLFGEDMKLQADGYLDSQVAHHKSRLFDRFGQYFEWTEDSEQIYELAVYAAEVAVSGQAAGIQSIRMQQSIAEMDRAAEELKEVFPGEVADMVDKLTGEVRKMRDDAIQQANREANGS